MSEDGVAWIREDGAGRGEFVTDPARVLVVRKVGFWDRFDAGLWTVVSWDVGKHGKGGRRCCVAVDASGGNGGIHCAQMMETNQMLTEGSAAYLHIL